MVQEHPEQSRTQGPGLASLSLKWGVQPMSSSDRGCKRATKTTKPQLGRGLESHVRSTSCCQTPVRGGETLMQSWGRPRKERSSPLAMG